MDVDQRRTTAPGSNGRGSERAGELSSPSTSRLAGPLTRLRERIRLVLIGRGAAELAALVLIGSLAVVLLDFVVRWPGAMRWIVWLAAFGGIVAGVRLLILPALRFRPSVVDVALRIEQTESGAPMRGLLASAVDLERSGAQTPGVAAELTSGVIERAERTVRTVKLDELVRTKPATTAGLRLGLVAVVLGVISLAQPELARIGAARLALPWADVEWPKRTMVSAVPADEVHALGRVLEVEALVTRTNRDAGETRVEVEYRVGGTTSRLRLTSQGRTATMDGTGDGTRIEGELFLTRLDLPHGGDTDEMPLEYRFITEDDRTPWQEVLLVTPPSIERATLTVEPPAYAARAIDPAGEIVVGSRSLGDGSDERGQVGPVLAGSRVTFEVKLNKPASFDSDPAWQAAWQASAREGVVTASEESLTLAGVAQEAVRLELLPTDRFGIQPAMAASFGVDVIEDAPPTAAVIEPRADEFVTPIAVVRLAGEGRDDLNLETLSLARSIARPPAGSAGAAPEPTGEESTLAARTFDANGGVQRQATVEHELDLATLALEPGDEVWVTALADDALSGTLAQRPTAASSVRRLRVISESELIDQTRDELNATRRAARRLDDQQAEVQRRTRDEVDPADAATGQRRLTDQIERQAQLLDQLTERLDRNRVDDEALAQIVADAAEVMRGAASASAAGEQQLEQAAQQDSDSPEQEQAREEAIEEAGEQQAEVRDRLGELSDLLDRGEDGWLVRRDVERLLEEQRELLERTEAVGSRTAGRSAEQLSPDDRSELERIAQRQRRAAERAQGVVDSLDERGRQLEEADPAAAQAMSEAAQQGRQAQLDQRLQEAAEQIQQNQTSNAAGAQQEAIDELEDILDRLDQAEQQREQTLRRILASAIESIEGLITQQERELQALAVAEANGDARGLDDGMIALHGNTLGVLDLLRTGYRELAPASDLIESAATAQTQAIRVLRADPVDLGSAEEFERTSLARLRDALAEAERLEEEAQQRDRSRELAQLRAAYREQLEQQVALRAQTQPLVGQELGRRQQRELRSIGQRQETIRQALAEIRAGSEGLEESPMVAFGHDRLDALAVAIGERAARGQNDASLLRRQDQMISILQAIYESLDPEAGQSDFRDQQQQQGGGQQGQGEGEQPLVPPLADLLLLREMQAQALEWTRALDEAQQVGASVTADELAELEGLQRSLAERAQLLLERESEPDALPVPGSKDREGGLQ